MCCPLLSVWDGSLRVSAAERGADELLNSGVDLRLCFVSDNFDWRYLRGLGKLLAYEFRPFKRKEHTRWIRRRTYRRRSLPFR